eukprot:gnl/Trimastix_PCT/4096.p1 GENE.gnl/Trimastix_PCT/4096~~gnl/Trimastix_PCT/4096.p1  ORF type:complete len:246 (-),score=18.98 gnl/Trimastix_PCT/4096:45-755(-)
MPRHSRSRSRTRSRSRSRSRSEGRSHKSKKRTRWDDTPFPDAIVPNDHRLGAIVSSAQMTTLTPTQKKVVEEAHRIAMAMPVFQDAQKQAQDTLSLNNTRIYVGSLSYELQEDEIKSIFSSFGPVKSVSLQREQLTGVSKGFCFLEFVHPESAEAALESMNGFMFGGRQIRVGPPTPCTQAVGAQPPPVPPAVSGLLNPLLLGGGGGARGPPGGAPPPRPRCRRPTRPRRRSTATS